MHGRPLGPKQEILVDSYKFYSGQDYGDIAFMKAVTGRWRIVKSLKRNERPSPRAFLLADKLKKAGLVEWAIRIR